jgi:hypothetical protein
MPVQAGKPEVVKLTDMVRDHFELNGLKEYIMSRLGAKRGISQIDAPDGAARD